MMARKCTQTDSSSCIGARQLDPMRSGTDHTPLDLWVLDERGRAARPWFTVVPDDYSSAVAGYALSLHAPSSIQTALALRQAIWRKGDAHWSVCGIPDTFYSDHGSDFTSHHMEQVAADLHMAVAFSIAGKPRGRGKVERIFETTNQLFLCHQPGYTPAGSPPARPVLSLPELDVRLRTFLVETYQQRVHSETGVAPALRWEASGFLPRLPESAEELDLLLLTWPKNAASTRTAFIFRAIATWTRHSLPTSARTSSSATTRATWLSCASTLAMRFNVGRSVPS